MLNDQDFEDEAAIQILAALITHENFHAVPPPGSPAGYAEKAYTFASALVEKLPRLKQ